MIKDVTILIPSFNEARFIKKAILSVVNQAEYVIVSDNCSTDGTQKICKKLAKQYPNIQYFEQKENIGSTRNGKFLLSKVQTKYLINMGAHDYLSDGYIADLKQSYEKNKDVVIAYAPYINVNENDELRDEELMDKLDTQFMCDNPSERILATILHPEYIFAIFGLFETALVKQLWEFTAAAGTDRLTLTKFASIGKFIRVPSARFYRRVINRDESPEACTKRMFAGTKTTKYNLTYMCDSQMELLKKSINKRDYDYTQQAESYFKYKCYRHYDKYKNIALEELLALQKIKTNKNKYILYGAGMESDYIINILQDNILFLADIDVAKQGKYKSGLLIQSPNKLKDYSDKIIISQITAYEKIFRYLTLDLGISVERIMTLPTQETIFTTHNQ